MGEELGYLVCGASGLARGSGTVAELRELRAGLDEDAFVWVELVAPAEAALKRLGEEFDLHPFVVRDATGGHRRSKMDAYGDVSLVVVRTVWYPTGRHVTESGEIDCVVLPDMIVTVRRGQYDPMADACRRLVKRPRMRRRGPWAVVYALLDVVADDHLKVCDAVESDVDDVERAVFSGGRVDMVERIYTLKREVLEFRDAAGPLESIVEDRLGDFVDDDAGSQGPYVRDLRHRVARTRQSIDRFETLLDSILDSHLGQISMWQNEDMRKISAWAAIIGAPTVVTGIYGMNFTHMPELTWALGYPVALAVILVGCVLLYRGFRRNGWL